MAERSSAAMEALGNRAGFLKLKKDADNVAKNRWYRDEMQALADQQYDIAHGHLFKFLINRQESEDIESRKLAMKDLYARLRPECVAKWPRVALPVELPDPVHETSLYYKCLEALKRLLLKKIEHANSIEIPEDDILLLQADESVEFLSRLFALVRQAQSDISRTAFSGRNEDDVDDTTQQEAEQPVPIAAGEKRKRNGDVAIDPEDYETDQFVKIEAKRRRTAPLTAN